MKSGPPPARWQTSLRSRDERGTPVVTFKLTNNINSVTNIPRQPCRWRSPAASNRQGGCGVTPRRLAGLATTTVERREAPRARSRRFSRGNCPVARAAPEARAGGNIRSRGAAHDPGASRRSISPFGETFLEPLAKLGRQRAARCGSIPDRMMRLPRSRRTFRRLASLGAEPLRFQTFAGNVFSRRTKTQRVR
jgi:hypothetical protein